MKKLFNSKWLIIIVISIGLVLFDSLIFNVSIIKRNIVMGIGLDYADGEYILTTQVILPKNGGVSSGGNNYVCYQAKAKDIDKAVDIIEKEQGAVLSFAQSAILILGRSMVQYGDLNVVDTFFMDDLVHDNLQLVMAEDKASDILKANVPAGEVASLQLVKQLRPTKAPLGVASISLQEYIRNSKDKNKINYMPVVKMSKMDASTDQSKEDVTQSDKFDLTSTAIMTNDGLKGIMDTELTQGFTIVKFLLQDGVWAVENGNENFSVNIVKSKPTTSFDLQKKEFRVKLQISTIRNEPRYDTENKLTYELSEDEMQKLNESIYKNILAVLDFGRKIKVDVFNVADGFYKKYPKYKSQIMNETFLNDVVLRVNIKITQV